MSCDDVRIMYISWDLDRLIESGRYYFWKNMVDNHNTVLCEFLNPNMKLFYNDNWFNRHLGTVIFRFAARETLRYNDIKNIRSFYRRYKPDIVIFEERLMDLMRFKGCLGIDVPKILILNDVHNLQKHFVDIDRFIEENDIRLCLSKMKYCMELYKDNLNCEVKWFPWSIETSIFKNYMEKKDYDVFSSGIVSPVYTLRYVLKHLDKDNRLENLNMEYQSYSNPGFISGVDLNNVREGYARKLSKSKIFLFGNSIYLFPIQKYFEGMASDCMVMAPEPHDSKELHFVPGDNFVSISQNASKEEVIDNIRFYIDNEKLRRKIVARANETINKYHTTDIRIKEFRSYLPCVVEG